ncbi:hypothetical protein G7Y79_00021g050150 [Physcia stellaris]|nr:hypothetical protein G7Y79_00021g050150 [Physcia stellaris]
MPNPMHLVARLCRRYPLSTFRSAVLIPLTEACGICIIALGLLVLFAATLLLDLGSSMLSSELGLQLTIEPTSDNTEEAPTVGSRGKGKEGKGSREQQSGRTGEVHQYAAEVSEEDANEEAAQPSPSSMSSPLSDAAYLDLVRGLFDDE